MSENVRVRNATNADVENIKQLVFGVLREYNLEPDPNGTDSDLSDIEANYIERGGVFEVLEDEGGSLLGTVGLFPIDDKTIELRKMYLDKRLRGRGIGKQTLERMIELARRLGFQQIYLETNNVLREAVALYKKYGFQETSEKHSPRCNQAFVLNVIGNS